MIGFSLTRFWLNLTSSRRSASRADPGLGESPARCHSKKSLPWDFLYVHLGTSIFDSGGCPPSDPALGSWLASGWPGYFGGSLLNDCGITD